ncbi:hypothetical protein SAMN05443428_13916 [Caloramator quimbayensis]|uniref:Uncharacterized protein n=1 Tax=Caloramator quimbayensis TaxID=1147123 RepID=A0A1T4YDV2_9CLOT|nr:hypothetical protein [Caloramator quimbayensis]SKA99934.1 hypothetical protein SAMN05443428_13916 [Caloramator quimbayensis]
MNISPQLRQALKPYYSIPSNRYKFVYFMWRNGLSNRNTDFSTLTEEEIIEKYCKGSIRKYNFLKEWENSEEYTNLMNILLLDKSNKELLEIYDVVLEKAKQGDDKAIKTFLLLQEELKKSVKHKKNKPEKEEQEDDGLILE